jgi:hypothetical protein
MNICPLTTHVQLATIANNLARREAQDSYAYSQKKVSPCPATSDSTATLHASAVAVHTHYSVDGTVQVAVRTQISVMV